MELLTRDSPVERRLRAFRAADAFTLEAVRLARQLGRRNGDGLADEIRRTAVLSGGAVVAASASRAGGPVERRCLETARVGLLEGRYYLYLARRLGLVDLRRYRQLASSQDAVLREVEALLTAGEPETPGPP
jgi:four helix bundle protein